MTGIYHEQIKAFLQIQHLFTERMAQLGLSHHAALRMLDLLSFMRELEEFRSSY